MTSLLPTPEPDGRARLVRLGVLAAALALVAGGGWLVYDRFGPHELDPDVVSAFSDQVDGLGAPRPDALEAPRIHGRLVAIEAYWPQNERYGAADARGDAPRWRLSQVHAFLSSDLAARAPADVGTIARIECREEVVGQYVRQAAVSGNAHRFFCEVALVDVAAGRTIHRQDFAGAPPPREVIASGHRYGEPPTEAIVSWLEGLPRS